MESLPFGVDLSLNARFLPNELALRIARRRIQDADQILRAESDGEQGATDLGYQRTQEARDLLAHLQSSSRPPLLRATLAIAVAARDGGGAGGARGDVPARVRRDPPAPSAGRPAAALLPAPPRAAHARGGLRRHAHGRAGRGDDADRRPTRRARAAASTSATRSRARRGRCASTCARAPSSDRNATILSVGALGSGKTTLDQKLKYEAFLLGARVIDCDPKGDHRFHLLERGRAARGVHHAAPRPGAARGARPAARGARAPAPGRRGVVPARPAAGPRRARLGDRGGGRRRPRAAPCAAAAPAWRSCARCARATRPTRRSPRRSRCTPARGSPSSASPTPTCGCRRSATARSPTCRSATSRAPSPGRRASEHSQAERVGEQIVRLIAMFAMHLMGAERERLKIFSFDEGWRLLGDPVGRTLLVSLQRMGRSELAVPIISHAARHRHAARASASRSRTCSGRRSCSGCAPTRRRAARCSCSGLDPDDRRMRQTLLELDAGRCLLRDHHGRVEAIQVDVVVPVAAARVLDDARGGRERVERRAQRLALSSLPATAVSPCSAGSPSRGRRPTRSRAAVALRPTPALAARAGPCGTPPCRTRPARPPLTESGIAERRDVSPCSVGGSGSAPGAGFGEGAVTGGDASASAPPSGGDPLVENGLGSPLCGRGRASCRRPGGATARPRASRRRARRPATTGWTCTSTPACSASTSQTLLQDYLVEPVWMGLVWVVHALIVALEWCFTLDLLDSSALGDVERALRATQASFTGPWLVLALALASHGGGLQRPRAPPRRGDARPGGADAGDDGGRAVGDRRPCRHRRRARAVGRRGQRGHAGGGRAGQPRARLADARAEHGRAVRGRPSARRGATWSSATSAGARIPRAWNRGCAPPASRSLARPRIANCASSERAAGSCEALPDARSAEPRAGALAQRATLLRAARTNGELFLALPANEAARNSIDDPGSLLRVLCGGAESATDCRGPTARGGRVPHAGRDRRPRIAGLLLIAIGALGMILLLGFIALHLLGAEILSLLYLLLAPAAVLAPALGDGGRAAFRTWATRLVGAVCSKLIFSFLLGVVLLLTRTLIGLEALGWWTRWLLVAVAVVGRLPPAPSGARLRRRRAPHAASATARCRPAPHDRTADGRGARDRPAMALRTAQWMRRRKAGPRRVGGLRTRAPADARARSAASAPAPRPTSR